jgi:hypothetical protein
LVNEFVKKRSRFKKQLKKDKMEDLAKRYGAAPGTEADVDGPGVQGIDGGVPASFELSRPSKDEARAALSQTNVSEIPDDVEDIDPRQWLQHDDSLVIDYVVTRAGRLKVAALDETEQDAVRKQAEKLRNPGRPQLGKDINLKLLRLWTVAFSLNKAYSYWGTPNELTANMISGNKKLSGEITTIVQRISEISGYKEDGASASSFLSVS